MLMFRCGVCSSLPRRGTERGHRLDGGFSLVEVMVAAFLLLIVFYGISQYYVRGRTQIDYEEDRRKATAIAEARLDGIRRDYRYDNLTTLNGRDTTYVVENKNFRVTHAIAVDVPESQVTRVAITVNWSERVAGNAINRSVQATTFLARGMPGSESPLVNPGGNGGGGEDDEEHGH